MCGLHSRLTGKQSASNLIPFLLSSVGEGWNKDRYSSLSPAQPGSLHHGTPALRSAGSVCALVRQPTLDRSHRAGWVADSKTMGRNIVSDNRAGTYHHTITDSNTFQYDRARAHPDPITDHNRCRAATRPVVQNKSMNIGIKNLAVPGNGTALPDSDRHSAVYVGSRADAAVITDGKPRWVRGIPTKDRQSRLITHLIRNSLYSVYCTQRALLTQTVIRHILHVPRNRQIWT